MKLHVVDGHHKVLKSWAEYRKTLTKPPRLITFDHHTDTSKPFRRLIRSLHKDENLTETLFNQIQERHLGLIDSLNQKTILEAIKKLNNDEHVVTAIKTDIISSALVLAHNAANTDLETYLEHKIICRTVNEILDNNGKIKPDCDSVLESSLLDLTILEFDKILNSNKEPLLFDQPFILDIDLDYFNTFKSIEPRDSKTFKLLAEKAGLITIATEPEYVKACSLDVGLTSDLVLERLHAILFA